MGGIVDGLDTVRRGAFATYTFDPGAIGKNGAPVPCRNCEHNDTEWSATWTAAGAGQLGVNPQGGANSKHLTCRVTVPAIANINSTFTVTATPKATCKCVNAAADTVVNCTGQSYTTNNIKVRGP